MIQTVLYEVGGTRRRAAASGIGQDEYMQWSRRQMIENLKTIFEAGVGTVIHPAIGPKNFAEVGEYRERLVGWIADGLAGEEALADYAKHEWRVRMLTDESIPQLAQAARDLRELTLATAVHTLWVHIIPAHDWFWQHMLTAVARTQATTQQQVIQAIYGEEIAPADIFIGHGKPEIFSNLLPVCSGNVQCYWRQGAGYDLTAEQMQDILSDYANRQTWRSDKSGRAEESLNYQELWGNGRIIGLGQRVGSFWVPR